MLSKISVVAYKWRISEGFVDNNSKKKKKKKKKKIYEDGKVSYSFCWKGDNLNISKVNWLVPTYP